MEHQVEFNFTGRYYTLGEPSQDIKQVWLACHGQGHLAQYFIKKFECLNDGRNLIVAPEGLSRYYLEGFKGRVGATWMTREDRLTDIENYLTFLTSVMREVQAQLSPKTKVTLFGFSQGAATISRFATQTDIDFNRLILWAGIFPPDLPPMQSLGRLKGKEIYWVYGTKDEFLNKGIMKEQKEIAKDLQVDPEVITFDGKHELDDKVLTRFI